MMLDTVDGPVTVAALGSRDIENCPRSMFEIRIGLDSKPGTVESPDRIGLDSKPGTVESPGKG